VVALWDLMRVVAITAGVAAGVGGVASTVGRQATFALWVAGAASLALGALSLPLTNSLATTLTDKAASERRLTVLYVAVFLGTTALCTVAVHLVYGLVAA